MKYFLVSFSIFFYVVLIIMTTDNTAQINVQKNNKLAGTWKVDSTYNEIIWRTNIGKGISHEWFEALTIRKDSFSLEKHEWLPPHTGYDRKEYFAANLTNYLIGTFHINKDTLLLDGYYTDYLFSAKVDRLHKYNAVLRFALNADTLQLTEYSYLNQRMIRIK